MTASSLTYNIPVFTDPFDKTKSNFAAPTTAQASNGWVDNVDVVNAEQQNYLHNASTTYLWLVQQLGLAMPFNPDGGGASLVATPEGGVVAVKDSSSGATQFYIAKNTRAIGYTDPSLDPTNWVQFNITALAQFAGFYANAGGTVNAITASYTVPYPVLVDGYTLEVNINGANTTTTPTFRPTINGSLQTARTIVKIVGNTVVALDFGDLNGVAQLRYDLANTKWILLNPNLWPNATNLSGGTVDATSVTSSGEVTSSSPTAGVGYATGAGGYVHQLTNKSTSVTLNKKCGHIQTHSASLDANAVVAFEFLNSCIDVDSVIIFNAQTGTAGAYHITTYNIAGGQCVIAIRNMTDGALSENLHINFAIINSVSA